MLLREARNTRKTQKKRGSDNHRTTLFFITLTKLFIVNFVKVGSEIFMKYNLIAKQDERYAFLLSDFIATTLSKETFEKIKEHNKKLFENYVFIPYEETDFSWWTKVSKKLYATRKGYKLRTGVYFDIDFYGNVSEI